MQVLEGQRFAGTVLRENRRLLWEIPGLLVLLGLMQLLEWSAAVLLLRIRGETPAALMAEDSTLWRLVQIFLGIPCGLAWIWCSWTVWLRCTRAAGILPENRRYSRGKILLLALQNASIRTVLLQSVMVCFFGAYRMWETAAQHRESAPWLFGAVQLAVLGMVCFCVWSYVSLGLCCVPFVWFSKPELPLWRIPLCAMAVMRGGRRELLGILAWYTVQMLPIVTIPWVLPRAGVAVTVFFNIRVRMAEEKYSTPHSVTIRKSPSHL